MRSRHNRAFANFEYSLYLRINPLNFFLEYIYLNINIYIYIKYLNKFNFLIEKTKKLAILQTYDLKLQKNIIGEMAEWLKA